MGEYFPHVHIIESRRLKPLALKEDEFSLGGLNSRTDLHVIMGMVLPPIAPTMSELATDIPAKYGNYYGGMDYTSKTINIPITIMAPQNSKSYLDYTQTLAGLLLTDEADNNQEIPLVFGFQPDLTYWGHITAISDPQVVQEGVWDTTSTITFIMSDPRATLPQVEVPLKNGLNTITVDGTAQTEPVIQIIPKRALKYVGYTLNGGNYGIGPEDPLEQDQAVQEWEKVLDDPVETMAMWSNDASAIGGLVPPKGSAPTVFQGEAMINDATSAMTVKRDPGGANQQFGPHQAGWYGPALRYTGLTQSLTDWRLRVGIHHGRYGGTHNERAMGAVQFQWTDTGGKAIGNFCIVDPGQNGRPRCRLQICQPGSVLATGDGKHRVLLTTTGPSGAFTNKKDAAVKIKTGTKTVKKTIRTRARNGRVTKKTINQKVNTYVTVWNRQETGALTDGWIKMDIQHVGHTWSWSVIQYNTDSGQPYTNPNKYLIAHSQQPINTGNKYQTALGGFGIMFLKHSITEDDQKINYKAPYMSLTGIELWKHNDVPDSSTPTYVASSGSEIVMDSEAQRTTIGGRISYPVWSTSYPKLKPGLNSLNMVGDLSDAKMVLKYLPRKL